MSKYFSDIININTRFCRSINIAQDMNNAEILSGYIVPASSEHIINTIADNINATQQSSFTWTGPYGSGKSSLALLFSALLGENQNLRKIALDIISSKTKDNLYKKLPYQKGWKILPIIGDNTSPENLIREAISAEGFATTDDLLSDLKNISNQYDGLVLFIDEMGKCLEHAVKGNADIYFFQKLAEFASRSNGKIIFIGILHQSFVEYARHLPHSIRDEWIKIQGRFIDMPVNTAGEEQIELISRAITSTVPGKIKDKLLTSVVDIISRNKIVASSSLLKESLANCWPLNPIVVCLISQISKKRFGQNQRSIFSFLNSAEPKAFRDFLYSTEYKKDKLYMPEDLFDYLKLNLESSILASSDSKIWNIVLEVLNRCQAKGASQNHITVLKTLSLIDLFAGTSGLSSTKNLLDNLYPELPIEDILSDLEKWSVIKFKKYLQSYSIYEGSDFDIEAALKEAYSNTSVFDLTKLSDISSFRPIIAKRHYHKYGAMRWFDVIFSTVDNYKSFIRDEHNKQSSVGFFVITLPKNADEENIAIKNARNKNVFDFPVVSTIAQNSTIINEYLKELLALEWIQKNKNELNGDQVARREIESRISIIISLLEVQLNKILTSSNWYYEGENIGTFNSNQLSVIASNICDKIYSSSPIIMSELVNRNKPSGSANGALNSLLKDMVLNEGKELLGLHGYNPERGLFNILLADTGIYKKVNDRLTYAEPQTNNLDLLWKATDNYLKDNNSSVLLTDLYDLWNNKPFGAKKGIYPFLALAYMLTRKNEVAVYLEGMYTPDINDLLVDYLLKAPKTISIRYTESDDCSKHILPAIVNVLNEIQNAPKLNIQASPLMVARKLVTIVDGLHPWVLKTKSLSKETIRFREIVKTANDPNKLLFEDLARAFYDSTSKEDKSAQIVKKLKNSLTELTTIYQNTMKEVALLLTTELDIPLATPTKLEELRERAKNIKDVSGNFRTNAFAARISTFNSTYEDVAGIISLANNKPPHDWIDLDIENAKKEILTLCTEFKKTELCTKVKNRPASRRAIAFITGIGGASTIVEGEFDILNNSTEEINKIKEKLKEATSQVKDKNLLLAALTEMSIEYLKAE